MTRRLLALAMGSLLVLPGCGWLVRRESRRLGDALAGAILDHPDPDTVEQGGAAYLLLVDGLIRAEPGNRELLRAGADLYSAYAAAFLEPESPRARRLAERALDYALRGAIVAGVHGSTLRAAEFEEFERIVGRARRRDVPSLCTLGIAWAGWIVSRGEDIEAVAEIARVEALMQRVVALDEGHRDGGAHACLGVLRAGFPEALGGRPADARKHFLRAVELSDGRSAMHKVLYAQHYARRTLDRQLHDRLLREVVESADDPPGHALMNALARRKARELLRTADEWFGKGKGGDR